MKTRILTVLCISCLLLCSIPVFGASEESLNNKNHEIGILNSSDFSKSCIQWFTENGIIINESSAFSESTVFEKNASPYSSGTAIIVTTTIDKKVLKQALIIMSKSGRPIDFSLTDFSKSSDSATYIDDVGGYFGVTGYAVYDIYYNNSSYSFYHPTAAYFMYTKRKTCTVSSMTVTYSCSGAKYTYPGFAYTGTSTTHNISVSKSSPAANTVYSNYGNPYSTSYCIDIYSGLGSGQTISFSYTVNDVYNSYTLPL